MEDRGAAGRRLEMGAVAEEGAVAVAVEGAVWRWRAVACTRTAGRRRGGGEERAAESWPPKMAKTARRDGGVAGRRGEDGDAGRRRRGTAAGVRRGRATRRRRDCCVDFRAFPNKNRSYRPLAPVVLYNRY